MKTKNKIHRYVEKQRHLKGGDAIPKGQIEYEISVQLGGVM